MERRVAAEQELQELLVQRQQRAHEHVKRLCEHLMRSVRAKEVPNATSSMLRGQGEGRGEEGKRTEQSRKSTGKKKKPARWEVLYNEAQLRKERAQRRMTDVIAAAATQQAPFSASKSAERAVAAGKRGGKKK